MMIVIFNTAVESGTVVLEAQSISIMPEAFGGGHIEVVPAGADSNEAYRIRGFSANGWSTGYITEYIAERIALGGVINLRLFQVRMEGVQHEDS